MSVANNQESTGKKPGGITGKGFQPGRSGNPSGRPKKRPITEMYEQILRSSGNRKKIRAAIEQMLFSGRMAGQLQLKEMAERVEGKVTQPVAVDGELRISLSTAIQAGRKRAGLPQE